MKLTEMGIRIGLREIYRKPWIFYWVFCGFSLQFVEMEVINLKGVHSKEGMSMYLPLPCHVWLPQVLLYTRCMFSC